MSKYKIDWITIQYRFVAWFVRYLSDDLLSIINEESLAEMNLRGHIIWEHQIPDKAELDRN